MSGQRLLKEMRPLMWPWFGVVLLAFLNAVVPSVTTIGFWIGLPLIAAISFGDEFENRTVHVLLSQPVDRMTIWAEKWLVMTCAVASAGLAYWFGTAGFLQRDPEAATLAALWIATVVCTTAFWTLFAQSTVGGLILTILQGVGIMAVWDGAEWAFNSKPGIRGAAAALAYALVMLWLGRHKLAHFQVAGTTSGEDVLMRNPIVRQGIIAKIWRCRPSGLLLNLVRKEVRLLWPVWLLAIVSVVGVGCLGVLRIAFGLPEERLGTITLITIGGLNGLLATVLAGSLSMGEERTWGTHSWQMTLPLSANWQWLAKLAVVLGVSFVGLVVPVLLAESIFNQSFSKVLSIGYGGNELVLLLMLSAIFSSAAFWCSCGIKGTVRAALWTLPAIAAVFVAFRLAFTAVWALGQTNALNFLVSPFNAGLGLQGANFVNTRWWQYFEPLAIAVPSLSFALVQSARSFRREIRDETLTTLRYLSRPAMATFVVSAFLAVPFVLGMKVVEQRVAVLNEVHQNIKRLQLDLTNTDADHPRLLTSAEIGQVISSNEARRLLAGSRLEVYVDATHVYVNKIPSTRTGTVTRIHLPGGVTCKTGDWFNARTGTLAAQAYVLCTQ